MPSVINLRASDTLRALIDRAADVVEQSRTDFMLEAAKERAERVLLDQFMFRLNPEQFDRFTALLQSPIARNPKLRRLLDTPAPWDK
jgi:uncharacterized protein (DUF1778 family)